MSTDDASRRTAQRTAWFHCFAGTAGDMSMGALVDAGADPAAVAEIVGALELDSYALTFEPVLRCGIAATHAVVVVHHEHGHDHDHDRGQDHEHEREHRQAGGSGLPHHSRSMAPRSVPWLIWV